MRLEVVERHLGTGSRLIKEVCVLPTNGSDGLDGCTVVVVPDQEELSAQRVPLALQRIREAVGVAASRSPHPVRIDDLVLLEAPLPRTPQGGPARDLIAERVREWPRSGAAVP